MLRNQPSVCHFSALTTLHVGGPAPDLITEDSVDGFINTFARLKSEGKEVLVLGEGSNLLVSDDGYEHPVLRCVDTSIELIDETKTHASLRVSAGAHWDDVVMFALDNGLSGIEALAGIPGSAGASPVQNIGAYGYEVSDVIESVQVYDSETEELMTKTYGYFNPGYRASDIKKTPGRYLVSQVVFKLEKSTLSTPIKYQQLAEKLGAKSGDRLPARQVAEQVVQLRRLKGMVYDENDKDSWSAGSFFVNPIVSEEVAKALPENAPQYQDDQTGKYKLSAAWLIENAGFHRGFSLDKSKSGASVSYKHTLALTNQGEATAQDIVDLARHVQEGVFETFNVQLIPEVNCIGFN